MFKFMYFDCTKKHDVAFHIKDDCYDFEEGENIIIPMAEEEKKNYPGYTPKYDSTNELYNLTLEDLNINIKDDNGNFRSTYNILNDISSNLKMFKKNSINKRSFSL